MQSNQPVTFGVFVLFRGLLRNRICNAICNAGNVRHMSHKRAACDVARDGQVKTKAKSSRAEYKTVRFVGSDRLLPHPIPCPPNGRRLIHRWRHWVPVPAVKEL